MRAVHRLLCCAGTGGRVAEGARLESVLTGNRYVGSNPTLSALIKKDAKTSVSASSSSGQVGERLKPPVSKTGMPARVSRVRIPPCPSPRRRRSPEDAGTLAERTLQ